MRTLYLTVLLMATTAKIDAQEATRQALASELATVNKHLLAGAALVEPARYGFQPNNQVRTFQQLVAHVADGHAYFCARAAGKKVEWTTPHESAVRNKTDALRSLRETVEECAAVSSSPVAELGELVSGLAHANLHYGNMIVYLRLLGLVPPSA